MEVVLEYDKICRACLSTSEPLRDLFSVCSPEVFQYCTSVEIAESDDLPRMICDMCFDLLNKMYYFKQVVVRTDVILRDHAPVLQVPEDLEIVENETEFLNPPCVMSMICDKLETQEWEQNEKEKEEEAEEISFLEERTIGQKQCQKKCRKPSQKRKKKRPSGKSKKTKRNKLNLKCAICQSRFQNYENLEAHMRKHFGKKPDIECSVCHKTFGTNSNLNSHMRVHSGVRKYQCQKCGKKFAYLNVLKDHELRHKGIKNHPCTICDAKFVCTSDLQNHIAIGHSKSKRLTCYHCDKTFSQVGNLKTHLIRHSGVKNEVCPFCDMRFYVKGDLEKHLRSHSTERPYTCDVCEKKFKTQYQYRIHSRTHTGERPYGCEICPSRFMTSKDLKHHTMRHTGEKPHRCEYCDTSFIQKCALNRHMKSHLKYSVDGEAIQQQLQEQNTSVPEERRDAIVAEFAPITVSYVEWQPVV